ncbi:MAG: four-carbon acid sugar kinase family protein [Burkholderiales bacterium]|nr:four-carbon acid sugar kinase family protein [Burkholderiales bacterium]
MLLGCIADDFTGATDLANNLVRSGMRTLQTIGVPTAPLAGKIDAVVVALKSRTIAASEAVAQSLAALDWLKRQGCRQFYFKYCSTFDSTPQGNIGPVAEALMQALGATIAIACPAFPTNARTIYMGNLFVGELPLSESGMRDHPLTPMTDANLVRVLQAQSRARVGLVPWPVVAAGAAAIRARFAALEADGARLAVVDAINDADLHAIAAACADHLLITAGSGVAVGLPENFRRAGLLPLRADADELPDVPGLAAVVSGSCSQATNAQVAHWMESGRPAIRIDPLAIARGEDVAAAALQQASPLLPSGPVLFYATATPENVKAVQSTLGVAEAGALVERALAAIAQGLMTRGVTRLVVAGGETSGAVVQALGVVALKIGPQIDPGVPWTATQGEHPILLALKSGNFGSRDFFEKSLKQLDRTAGTR